jgi:hypothetical protein
MNNPVTLVLLMVLSTSLFSADPIDVLTKTKWVSDKAETLKWIGQHRPDLARSGKLADAFGKMMIEFTKSKVTTHLDGQDYVREQKILGQTAKEIALQTFDPGLKREVIVILEIDDDEKGYWIYERQFDVKEHFVPAP